LNSLSLFFCYYFRFLQRDGTHHQILLMNRNLILQIVLGCAAERANTHFLILESFYVITDSRAFVAYNVSTSPTMMPPTQKVEFPLTYITVSFYGIWNPIGCRFTNLWLWHSKVITLTTTLVGAVAEKSRITIKIETTRSCCIISNWHSHHISLTQQEIWLGLHVQHIAIWSLFLLSCCPAPSSYLFFFHAIFNHFGINNLTWLGWESGLPIFNTIII